MGLVESGSVVGVKTCGVCIVFIIHKYLSFCQVVYFDVKTTTTVPRRLTLTYCGFHPEVIDELVMTW